MDWKIPVLKFRHLIQVRDQTGLDLADLEHCAELDNIRQLGLVIGSLSSVDMDNFHGNNIKDAYEQLMQRLQDFFPPHQSQLLSKITQAQKEFYQTSGSLAGEQQAG